MFARIASFIAAALLAAAIATPAHAGGEWWVKTPNGAATNTTGFVVKGIELPAHLR